MSNNLSFLLLLVVLACQVACSGKHNVDQPESARVNEPTRTRGIQPDQTPSNDVPDAVLWQRLVDEPGEAGVDYLADEVLVVYNNTPQPLTTEGTSPSSGDKPTAASLMANSILRENTGFEVITQAVADTCNLEIRQQVYLEDLNIASFRVPEGRDASSVLLSIRTEFSAQVDWAIHNPLRKATYTPNDPDFNTGSFGMQWGHWKIGCTGAWDHTLGDPAVWIAVVDTGVRLSHEELSGQVLIPATQFPGNNLDIVNGDNTVEDNDGHGTFISGIAVAAGNNNRSIVGVAPGCRVLPVKISNDGEASTADIIAGCLLAQSLGAKVINLSFGGYEEVPAEENMVNQIWAGGGILVCAAGNEGYYTTGYPGEFTNSFCVGASDYWDEASIFTNWGPGVDIAAPGQELKSCGITSNSTYEYGQGTSYSAPMVAAGAALLWSFDPSLTNAEVRNTLTAHSGIAWNFATIMPRLSVSRALLSLVPEEIPSIIGVQPAADSVYGNVVNSNVMNVSVAGATNVTAVTYTLDVQPLGQIGPDDPTKTITGGGSFSGTLPVPSTLPNQYAKLVVDYVSNTGHTGEQLEVPLVIFNQPGDINQDGLVNQLDIDDLVNYLGTSKGSPGWSLFADGTNDGYVNELDLSVIGYNWGDGAVAPEITLVSPLEGTGGDTTTFFVDVTGTEPFEYSWEFADATVPATSSDESPEVELTVAGTHEFGVTVSNIAGSDYFPFQFEMAPTPVTVIDSVNPTEGYIGEVVDFSINWSVFEPNEFSWDFGSAGIPGTSTESVPSVELTSEGVFSCSVYAGNGGDGDTFEFDLTVNPTPQPVADLRANPQMGQPPLFVEFDASDSYSPAHTIVQYEWSWDGDTTWEVTSDQPLESYTFNDLETYTVRLQVTDETDRTAQTTVDIRVMDSNVYDNWVTTPLGPWGNRSQSTRCSDVTNVAGRPAIAWTYDQDSEPDRVFIALADNAQPQVIDDWNVEMLREASVDDATIGIEDLNGEAAFVYGVPWQIYYGKYNGTEVTQHLALNGEIGIINDGILGVIADKPVIFFRGWTASIYGYGWFYVTATSSNPLSEADWQVNETANIKVDTHITRLNQLMEINGLPMLLGEDDVDGNHFEIVNFASSTEPAEGDWSNSSIGNENHNGFYRLLVNHNEKPAVIANDRIGAVYNIKYAYSNSATPAAPGDWTLYEPVPGTDSYLVAGGFIGGNPAFYYEESESLHNLVIAQTPTPTSPDDWIIFKLENTPWRVLGFVDHGGLPGMFGVNGGELVYMYPIP